MNAARTLLLLAALLPALVQAGPQQDIELTDGSVVRAEVIALDHGIYSLRSDSLGEIKIPAAKINSITKRSLAAGTAAAAGADRAQLDELRQSLVRDPATLGKIESLQNEPVVKDILNDEQTMRAIHAGDLDALMNDPKIKALMEHSTVQEITQGAGL
jgi:hypothetical protein